MDDTTKALIKSVAEAWFRHAVSGAGVWLAAHGLITNDQTSQFTGAAVFIAGLAWTTWDKYGRKLALDELAALRSKLARVPAEPAAPPAAAKAAQRT